LFASSLLLLLAVQWKPVVDAAPVFTPVPTLVPVSETNNETKQESTASSTPRWQRVEPPTNGSATSNPVRWAQAPTSPEPIPTPIKPQQPPKPQAIARSVGRAFSYGGVLYPEVGFWVPTAFRQDVAHRGTLTFQIESKTNPYNIGTNRCGGWRVDTSNRNCSDSRWLAEFTPLIIGDFSLGVNANMAESIVNRDTSSSPLAGDEGLGLAFGFQLKANLDPTLGAAWIGEKLVSTDNTGPIGTTRVRGTVAADGGQSYAILLSKLFDLGPIFGSKGDPPAVISVSAGVGNGFFKPANQTAETGLNYGTYGPIANIGFSFNQHLSVFAEYAGLLAGFGASYKPFTKIPLTASILYHSWRGQVTDYKEGQPYNSSCGTELDLCKGALNTRLTFSF